MEFLQVQSKPASRNEAKGGIVSYYTTRSLVGVPLRVMKSQSSVYVIRNDRAVDFGPIRRVLRALRTVSINL